MCKGFEKALSKTERIKAKEKKLRGYWGLFVDFLGHTLLQAPPNIYTFASITQTGLSRILYDLDTFFQPRERF